MRKYDRGSTFSAVMVKINGLLFETRYNICSPEAQLQLLPAAYPGGGSGNSLWIFLRGLPNCNRSQRLSPGPPNQIVFSVFLIGMLFLLTVFRRNPGYIMVVVGGFFPMAWESLLF